MVGASGQQLGRGEYEMACWPTPFPAFISVFGVAERFFPSKFSLMVANLAQLALLHPKKILKLLLIKLINTNNIII